MKVPPAPCLAMRDRGGYLKLVRRGYRSEGSRERRKRKRLSTFDQKTGEVINIQERYIKFEKVPKNLGFVNMKPSEFEKVRVGIAFLHLGEVLVDWRGEGTIQANPEMFISNR